MFKLSVLVATAAIALAGSAAAGVTFTSYGTALPTGQNLVTDFSTSAYLTGNAVLFTGSQGGVSAAPAFSASTQDTAQYLSVQGGESGTVTFANTNSVSIYVGSLDTYNTVTFGGPGGQTFTGSQLGAISGAANGNQTAPNTNGRFLFTFSAPVNAVTLSSSGNAFEVADVTSGAPEPAVWAMMLVGFGLAGAGLRSRRRVAHTA